MSMIEESIKREIKRETKVERAENSQPDVRDWIGDARIVVFLADNSPM